MFKIHLKRKNMSKIKSPESPRKNSILNTDLYKLTMNWAIIKNFPDAKVRYEFIDRNHLAYPEGFATELRKIVDGFRVRNLSPIRRKELEKACPYLPSAYLDFLEGYKFDPSEVGIIQKGAQLSISIEGYWYRTVLWEVPLMAEICELYYKMTGQTPNNVDLFGAYAKASEKANLFYINNVQYVDFGTRRAYSFEHQANIIDILLSSSLHKNFIGSSNVELALYHGIKPIGTYAHEYVSGNGVLYGYAHANLHAMENWVKTYNGNLGIALTDTFTTDAFLADFDSKYANLFTGVRHDSDCPFKFTDKIIDHYKKLGIDPSTKTIVYSDGLNPETVLKLHYYRHNEIRRSYGIGTNLTNDIPGVLPLNIVIKLVELNGIPAVKLSDSSTKHVGDAETIKFIEWQLKSRKIV